MSEQHSDFGLEMALSAEEIDDLVSQFRLHTSDRRLSHQQMQKFFRELPSVTEAELVADGKHDAACPICFNAFFAVLAEEETARAMDSPAHPVEELGVTKLQKTCGHLFCRKDIMRWISEGHGSCPNCRRPLLTDVERRENESRPLARDWFRSRGTDSSMDARGLNINQSRDISRQSGPPEGLYS